MNLMNYLKIILSVAFIMCILSLTHAGQKGVVLSPDKGETKVETDASKVAPEKVKPGKVEPKAVPEETKVAPKKRKVEIKEPQKATFPVKCNRKVVTILGTSGDDVLNGTRGPDVIHGLGGDDIIRGMGGNDTICGGDGNDKLDGGKGNDILDGGPGRDECINGPSGKGILVAPKNCEKIMTSPKVDISPKTQRKSIETGIGFVPDKPAQKAQLETQKKFEAKKKAIASQQDFSEQESNDTSLGKITTKPSSLVKFQTHLSIKRSAGLEFTQWVTEWIDNSPEVLNFRWKTIKGTNEFSGKWQISLLKNFNTILFEGDAGTVPGLGEEYRWFSIDFTTWRHPIPATYYVRVVPITESKMYSPSPPVTVSIITAGDTYFDFISDVVVQPHGTYAKFFITTTNSAKLKLRTFYSKKPFFSYQDCREDVHSSWTVKSTFAYGWKTQWDTHIGDLIPEHTYGWIVCAEDKDGVIYKKSGTFKTLKRRVKVTVTHVDIIDDMDELSAGECQFGFWLNGQEATLNEPCDTTKGIFAKYPPYEGTVYCDTGGTTHLGAGGVVLTLVGTKESTVKFNATGEEIDTCTGGGLPRFLCPSVVRIKTGCANSIGCNLIFDVRPSGLLVENIFEAFQLKCVNFLYHGYLKVDYIK